jgi:glycosyltransferase involved in cell wall biosynthesis
MALRRRILFCTLGYEPGPVGGAERQARLQAEELVRRGHTVDVVTPGAPHVRSGALGGVSVHRLPRIHRRFFRTVTYLPVLAAWLLFRIRRYDLVHVHLGNLQADVAGVACRLFNVPLYVKLAAGGPRGEIGRMRRVAWLTHYVGLRTARRIQATSDEIERDISSVGIAPSRVVRIPNGLPQGVFEPAAPPDRDRLRGELQLPSDQVLVLYAGRFAGYKGVLDLIAAWREVPEVPPATLVLVGEPALDDPVPVPTLPRTIIRPWTSGVARYLQACDIYVHPSHVDGMPNVVLEAMACGLAVVATRVAAVPTMIQDGVTGDLVDIGSVPQLRAAIQRLVSDPDTRERLGRAASERAHREYPIERVVDAIEAAYEQMLTERAS